jgi:hypothetical protein
VGAIELTVRRGLDALAALSVRVVKVREETSPPLDAEALEAIERCVERGDLADLYFGGPRVAPRFGRVVECNLAFTLRAIGEPPLASASADARATYRLLRQPSFKFSSLVRIARRDDGWEIMGRLFSPGMDYAPRAPFWERTRRLGDVEARRLEELLRDLHFHDMPVSVDRDGLDGTTWLLEGVNGGTYHVVERWSPEERPLLDLGDYLTALSGIGGYPPKRSIRDVWAAARRRAAWRRAHAESQRRYRRSVDRSNRLARRLAAAMAERGVTCPHCGTRSRDMRYVDKGPGARAYFICRSCGRSCHPE